MDFSNRRHCGATRRNQATSRSHQQKVRGQENMFKTLLCSVAAVCVIVPDVPVLNLSGLATMCYILLRWVSDLEFRQLFLRMSLVILVAGGAALYKYSTLNLYYIIFAVVAMYILRGIVDWAEKESKSEFIRR